MKPFSHASHIKDSLRHLKPAFNFTPKENFTPFSDFKGFDVLIYIINTNIGSIEIFTNICRKILYSMQTLNVDYRCKNVKHKEEGEIVYGLLEVV